MKTGFSTAVFTFCILYEFDLTVLPDIICSMQTTHLNARMGSPRKECTYTNIFGLKKNFWYVTCTKKCLVILANTSGEGDLDLSSVADPDPLSAIILIFSLYKIV